MTSEAGPPVCSTDPDETKRPVPAVVPSISYLCTYLVILARSDRGWNGVCLLTDRTTNGNHLQMTALQLTVQGRIGRVLGGCFKIKDIAVGANLAGLGDMGIGIALETVDEALAEAASGLGFTIGIGWRLVGRDSMGAATNLLGFV